MAGKRKSKKTKKSGKGKKVQVKKSQADSQVELPIEPPLPSFKGKPPPIFIDNTYNYGELCKGLVKVAGKDGFIFKTTSNHLLLFTNTFDIHKLALKYLKDSKHEFFTYKMIARKPLKVFIRGLAPDSSPEELEKELRKNGFLPKEIANVVHPTKGEPLPLFSVVLEPGARNKAIFDVKRLFDSVVVRVEKPHPKREIVQCHRCQGYGHTRNYCQRLVRCVKCAGGHEWRDCTKSAESDAVCANCEGSHPANWRGCPTHKELVKRKKVGLKQASETNNFQKTVQAILSQMKHLDPTIESDILELSI